MYDHFVYLFQISKVIKFGWSLLFHQSRIFSNVEQTNSFFDDLLLSDSWITDNTFVREKFGNKCVFHNHVLFGNANDNEFINEEKKLHQMP